jgi:uncharacterized protein (DUF427 family)
MKAIWNGKVIAQSDHTINIEGNQYFPFETVNKEFLIESNTHSVFTLGITFIRMAWLHQRFQE